MFGLTPEQYFLFLSIHINHLKTIGTENQKKYCLSKVRNVEWDSKRKCLNVYYDDTSWKYDDNGWY